MAQHRLQTFPKQIAAERAGLMRLAVRSPAIISLLFAISAGWVLS
jgi:hypothetical protein